MKPNAANYRYDRVTMGILMSDFAFSKGSAAPETCFQISNSPQLWTRRSPCWREQDYFSNR